MPSPGGNAGLLEWMPIREDAPTLQGRIYRAFRFGNLATLFMLDTRMIGRDCQVLSKETASIEDRSASCSAPNRKAGWRSSS